MTIDKKEFKKTGLSNSGPYKILAGLIGLGLIVYLGISFVGQSGANNFKLNNPVGKDLLITDSNQTIRPTGETGVTTNPTGKIPATTDYLTPASDYIDPFEQKKVLEFITHQVQPGESLWSIAKTYGRTVSTVASVNYKKLKRHGSLPVDMKLKIPNRDGILTRVKKGQTLWDLGKSYDASVKKILRFNQLESAKYISKNSELFIPGAEPLKPYNYRFDHGGDATYVWPVSGGKPRITSEFGPRMHPVLERKIFHTGIDIAGDYGQTAHTSRPGRVKFVGEIEGYGKVVTVVHSSSCKTLYAHLSKHIVKTGQYLEQRQPIGKIGSTGLATGANLHFEIRKNGKPSNPLKHLPKQ